MMRKEAFTPDVETFAAKRRNLMTSTDKRLEPHVRDALLRVGLPSWQTPLVREASDVFEEVVVTESEGWSQDLDSLRKEFQRELTDALDKTKKVDPAQFDQQVERITRWVSAMSINAGTEASTSTDPDPVVGLEWVTMEDDKVREAHKEANGQQTVTGKPFEVGGEEMMYPGQPVGDPANWMNCRCVVRPAMLGGETMSLSAAGAPGLHKDGTPPVCKYCEATATQYVLHSEGMAYVPACDEHIEQAKTDAAASVPGGEPDAGNIDRVASYSIAEVVADVPVDDAPMIPDEEASVQVMFHGVAAPEGVTSGDGRRFAIGALTNRPLPLPMKAMFKDAGGHEGSVIAGRIDRIWMEDNLMKYEGVFDMSEAGYEALRLVAEGMWRGVSVDVDQAVGSPSADGGVEFSAGRVSAITMCAIPSFAEAFIAIGPAEDPMATPVITGEEATSGTEVFDIPPVKTMDGPGWITDPVPTQRITSYWVSGPGRAKIAWGVPGDFNRCRVQLAKYVQNPEWLAGLCANLHYRALGVWPGRPMSGETVAMQMDEKAELPSVTLTASAATAISADYFRNPELKAPTPLTVTEDGHVFGHVAGWDTCHIANPEGEGVCTVAPHSETAYGYFMSGEVVTDAGRVPVGQISFGGGHADERLGLRAAMAHYDNTSTAVADITVGEDEHGVWFSGKLREDVTPAQIHAIRAAGKVSGDWRGVIVHGAESLEMMAALVVNVPGFPIARASYAMDGDRQLSLVAAGAVEPRPVISEDFEAQMQAYTERQERRARLAAIRDKNRAFRLDALKVKIESEKEQ